MLTRRVIRLIDAHVLNASHVCQFDSLQTEMQAQVTQQQF